tara:strand:- start:33750 stop:35510 length:1761 start_codon:yes stop_codon:yes gene_type:complete
MDAFERLKYDLINEIKLLTEFSEVNKELDLSLVNIEPPRDSQHGDLASNAALVLSRQLKTKPMIIAEKISERMQSLPNVKSCNVAAPGFLNFILSDNFWHIELAELLDQGSDYGYSDIGKGRCANIEYVSANPTGPLHVGHGRGTVFGDVLANLLTKVGFNVTREYYVNDAGAQVDTLAKSVYLRYREALGENITDSDFKDSYPGEYLIPVASELIKKYGDKYLNRPENEWLDLFRSFAVGEMLKVIREDLDSLGVHHDIYSSENNLVTKKSVEKTFQKLVDKKLIYEGTLDPPKGENPPIDWEPRPQSLFRSSEFGDDVDRPLRKSDGSWTYFATDIAYHVDKVERGFNIIINIWGADHAGYIKRLKSSIKALVGNQVQVDIKLCQLVKLLDRGQPVKMSKRAGQFITLRDLVDEVGKDVVRFIMLTRRNDAPLDFDLAKVKDQSRENPVFYVQYAHARVRSVLRNVSEVFPSIDLTGKNLGEGRINLLTEKNEMQIIKKLAEWPSVLKSSAIKHEPHRIAFYLQELSSDFHSLWNIGKESAQLKFILKENEELTLARISLIYGVGQVLANGLNILGIKPIEEMR